MSKCGSCFSASVSWYVLSSALLGSIFLTSAFHSITFLKTALMKSRLDSSTTTTKRPKRSKRQSNPFLSSPASSSATACTAAAAASGSSAPICASAAACRRCWSVSASCLCRRQGPAISAPSSSATFARKGRAWGPSSTGAQLPATVPPSSGATAWKMLLPSSPWRCSEADHVSRQVTSSCWRMSRAFGNGTASAARMVQTVPNSW
mmetsp:Transcript_142461/g.355057  ORF Transcript_142461/g.355057 Transcript_142461/m.355057 type:complete len:206 (-) Transcript_142461:871-1488(-)